MNRNERSVYPLSTTAGSELIEEEFHMSNVLVTGGSGFLAGWTIRKLLEQGHTVRTTVRSEKSGETVRQMLAHEGVDTARYSSVLADLGAEKGWAEAMEGIDCVLHIASPLGGESHNDPALVETAKAGAVNVIGAALRAKVKKIVMTSSAAAVFPGREDTRQNIDESYWTNMDGKLVTHYMRSKVVAEKTAWDLVRAQHHTKLVTILPGAIFGPFMNARNSSTDLLFTTILRGTPSPKATFHVVDVRDLADLHILAMTSPQADGERFIAQPGEVTMPQMARLLKDQLGQRGTKISTMTIPDFVIKIGAHFNPALAVMNTTIGMKHRHDTSKAQRLLGWKSRPVNETVVQTAEYVLDNQLV
jgi:nucleoside-diphosphate-sugar epimerase